MIWELIGALALGAAAVWFVLAPVGQPLAPERARPADPFDVDETPRSRAVEALREIEFDRATGKLSDADYAALKSRYTGLAVQAMRQERAAAPDDADLEAMIAARRGQASSACETCGPRPEPDAVFCSTCGGRLATGRLCMSCAAPVPADGVFCERCGARAA